MITPELNELGLSIHPYTLSQKQKRLLCLSKTAFRY